MRDRSPDHRVRFSLEGDVALYDAKTADHIRCDPDAMDKAEQNKRYFNEIKKLIDDEFYGKIVISMEKGRVVFLRKEQTIKL